MKRIIICLIVTLTAMVCVACENYSYQTNAEKQDEEASAGNTSQDSKSEFITEVAKENYKEIPDEAMVSFDYVADAAKLIFKDLSGKWMYGYKGTQEICGESCYVFTVYNENDNESVKVGTLAKSDANDSLYLLDGTTGTYSKISVFNQSQYALANTSTVS